METKKSLFADTVLRKDGDQLCLMNRQEGGFRAWAIPIESEQWFVDHYNVRVGEWTRDEHGEYCPVTRIPRSEQPTLHDGVEEVKAQYERFQREYPVQGPLLKVGCRLLPHSEEGTLVPYVVNGKLVRRDSKEEIRGRMEEGLTRAQALGRELYQGGALEDQCFQPGEVSPGLQQFLDAHPGARVGMGPGPFLVALMPDGSALAVDQDGTVIAEDDPALDDDGPVMIH